MAAAQDRPQRISIVIEKTDSGIWTVTSYLIGSKGQRERRCLATCETHDDAAWALGRVWEKL